MTVTGIVVSWNPLIALVVLLSPVLPVAVNPFFVKRLRQVERDRSEDVKLLTRLHEPTSGQILLGGNDIQEIDLNVYRDQLAVLFQDFIQYEASLRQNVGFGR